LACDLVDPETGEKFVLYPAEERFTCEALTLKDFGQLVKQTAQGTRLLDCQLTYDADADQVIFTRAAFGPSQTIHPKTLADYLSFSADFAS
jgi:hypothetical protein